MWPEGTFKSLVLAAGSFIYVTGQSSNLRKTLKVLRKRGIIFESVPQHLIKIWSKVSAF